jgi:hypothetical protein
MNTPHRLLSLSVFTLAGGSLAMVPLREAVPPAVEPPAAVEIIRVGDRFELRRGGESYYIRGAGGVDHLEALVEAGGNSLRTWGEDQTAAVIDEAHALGLSVLAGIWIEHERHGFDYDDEAAVAAQIARHRATVDRFKDHPALLLWGVGNEVSINARNPRVWDVIEAVAAYIREVDGRHPVMTVLPHVSAEEVRMVRERCPSVDLLGFNTYAGIDVVGRDARRFGWDGPFVIAEWGPDGNWEVEKTPWGAEIEPTTTEKAALQGWRYTRVLEDPHCLGSYCFYWGQKQETTPTWFNLFLEDGAALEAVEVMQYLWTGTFPARRAPALTPLRLNGRLAEAGVVVRAGEPLEATCTLLRGEPEELSFRWELLRESADKRQGGDREERPEALILEAAEKLPTALRFSAPAEPGAYRLFLYVENDSRRAASANFPFLVEERPEE